jgi:hypothetical protein
MKAGKGRGNASEDLAEAPFPGAYLYARLAQFPEDLDLQTWTCTASGARKAVKGKGTAAQEPADTPFPGTYGGRGKSEKGTKATQLKTLLKPPPVVPTSTTCTVFGCVDFCLVHFPVVASFD